MSTRPITEDDLQRLVDETLDAKRHAEVASYLLAHPDIAARVAGYRSQRDMLRDALAPVMEEPIPPQLNLSRMIEAQQAPRAVPRWWMAAAATVLLCAGGLAGWSLRGAAEPPLVGVAALTQEAMASYAVFAPDRMHPVEIKADDRDKLNEWIARRLGHSVPPPDLAGAGYWFMGGRIVATGHGPAALFMYDNDSTRLVLLVRPMEEQQTAPMAPNTRGGVDGYTWAHEGMGYSLVGETDLDVLRPIAREAQRQTANST
jgi:anti-sigma factor RsiW